MVLGIDPGASGGMALILPDGKVYACKMPDTEREICEAVKDFAKHTITALIEKVGPARGRNEDGSTRVQGVSSAFSFGRNYGFLRGVLVALEIPFDEISPQHWQAGLGLIVRGQKLTYAERKRRNKQKAENLFPSVRVTNAIADALLIAEFGRRIRG